MRISPYGAPRKKEFSRESAIFLPLLPFGLLIEFRSARCSAGNDIFVLLIFDYDLYLRAVLNKFVLKKKLFRAKIVSKEQ